jgi:hypothetical protein
MALFPVASNGALFVAGPVAGTDIQKDGFFFDSNGYVRAVEDGTVAGYTQGVPVTSAGLVCVTTGAVAGYSNGLPMSSGGLICVSSVSAATYSNGLPMSSDGKLYAVSPTPASWVTVSSWTPSVSTASSGWDDYTIRLTLDASLIVPATRVRFTFQAWSANSFTLDACYTQVGTTGGNFNSAPVQVKFSGANGVTVAAGGTVVSDEVALPLLDTDVLCVAFHFTTAANITRSEAAVTGWTSRYKLGNDTTTQTISGYTTGVTMYCMTKVESIN